MNMRASIIESLEKTNEDGCFRFCFSKSDAVFAGHFPDRPILPGVFQIEMARVLAEKVLSDALQVREVARAKFLRPILPEEKITARLKLAETGRGIEARAKFSVEENLAGEIILWLGRV
ncbi:MAG: hypothetical protein ABJC04_08100 [Verrucomicrobiota bacterium]